MVTYLALMEAIVHLARSWQQVAEAEQMVILRVVPGEVAEAVTGSWLSDTEPRDKETQEVLVPHHPLPIMEPEAAVDRVEPEVPEVYPHAEQAVPVFPVRLRVLQSIMPVAVAAEVDSIPVGMVSPEVPGEAELAVPARVLSALRVLPEQQIPEVVVVVPTVDPVR
jgi:hypothetical protein